MEHRAASGRLSHFWSSILAQMVLAVGGAALGNAILPVIGGPIGAALGSTLGGFIDNTFLFPPPHQTVIGGKIGDVSIQRSQWGLPIPRPFGAARVTCPVIWANPVRQALYVTTTGGGKGQPKTTTKEYAYYADFAVLIGAGPLQAVKGIWLNGQLYGYSRQVGGGGMNLTVTNVGLVNYAPEIQTSRYNGYAANFGNTTVTIWLGTPWQGQDPVILAAKGASRTPAYRNRAYIVFHNLPLNSPDMDFGGRLPTVEVEFIQEGHLGYGQAKGQIPLHAVLWPLCRAAGLTIGQVDMTQLTQSVRGGIFSNVEPARSSIMRLASAYLFEAVELDGKVKFVQQPAPLWRLEYQNRVLIGETGLIVNAYHDDLGRGGYFNQDSGTSEGQLLMINGCLRAYQVTGNASWLNRALFMAAALEATLYGATVPTAPSSSTVWAPHWLFAARRPIQLQSFRLDYLLPFSNNGDGTMTGVMPPGPGHYGDLVKRVFSVYAGDGSAFLQWDNPYSPVIGTTYSIISVTTSVNGDGSPQVNTGTTTIKVSAPDGNSPACKIAYTYQCGPVIGVGEGYEAWPCWRQLAPGEIDCAPDAFYWALDCFDRLKAIDTPNATKWQHAFDATKYTIANGFAVDDGRNWVRPQPGYDAYSLGGAYDASVRPGMSPDNWSRDPNTGYVIGAIPFDSQAYFAGGAVRLGNPANWYTDPHGNIQSHNPVAPGREAQYGRGITDTIRSGDTSIRVEIGAACGLTAFGTGGGATNEIAAWISTQSTYSPTTRYYCWLDGQSGRPGPILGGFGTHTFDIPIAQFKNSLGVSIAVGATVAVIGISDFEPVEHQVTLKSFRPLPILTLPYQPNVCPFTVNLLYGSIVDWRGAPGSGYQHAYLWRFCGSTGAGGPLDASNTNSQIAFMQASQAAYTAQSPSGSISGPFHAAYVWDRYDASQTGAVNQWTWNWPDPNTMWGGYQYRPLCSLARTACPSSVLIDGAPAASGNAAAAAMVKTFLDWLDGAWATAVPQGGPPTNFRAGVAPTIEYDEPHFAALILRAAMYGHLASGAGVSGAPTIARCQSLIQKAYNYLARLYVSTGPMAGSWCTDLLTSSVQPAAGWTWYGFWHGEIIETLATFQYEGGSIITAMIGNGKLPSGAVATMNGWLAGSDSWLTANTRTITPISRDELGAEDAASVGASNAQPIWQQTRMQDPDLPNEVQVWFADPVAFYQQNVRYARRLSKSNVSIERIDTNLALLPNEAQDIAYRNLYVRWLRRNPIEWSMSRKYMPFAPGDVIELPLRGQMLPVYIQRIDYSAPGILKFTGVDHDP
jgi:hypothetical protein